MANTIEDEMMSRFSNNRQQPGPVSGDSSPVSSPRYETSIANTVMENPNAPTDDGIQDHQRFTRHSTAAPTLMPPQNSGTRPDLSKPIGIRKKKTRQVFRIAQETIYKKLDGCTRKKREADRIDKRVIEGEVISETERLQREQRQKDNRTQRALNRVERKRLDATDAKIILETGTKEHSKVGSITVGEFCPAPTYERCTWN
jgi:hypothetical protein